MKKKDLTKKKTVYPFCNFSQHLKNVPKVDEKEDKIVGGDIVNDISERPFQVAFEYAGIGFQFCGGAIVDDFTVLTAAHCCAGQAADEVVVRAGALRVENNPDGKVFEITKIIEDDRHSSSTKRYDGCILKTKEPLTSATGYVLVISVF